MRSTDRTFSQEWDICSSPLQPYMKSLVRYAQRLAADRVPWNYKKRHPITQYLIPHLSTHVGTQAQAQPGLRLGVQQVVGAPKHVQGQRQAAQRHAYTPHQFRIEGLGLHPTPHVRRGTHTARHVQGL